MMKIEEITLKNFKAFQHIKLENLPSFVVVIGKNGTGKTSFFDIFGFLHDCLKDNISVALDARGGFDNVISRGHENETILIEIKYRILITGKARLVTYHLEIAQDEFKKPYVKHEFLRFKRGGRVGYPYCFLKFQKGKGYAVTNEDDFEKTEGDLNREEQTIDANILAIKGVGQFDRFIAAKAFRELIEKWHVSDFHISDARGRKDQRGENQHLTRNGDNLARYAFYLSEHHPERFQKILDGMVNRVPGVHNIETKKTEDGYLILLFKDDVFNKAFLDRQVSDGTIKMFAYLALLNDPEPHPLLCIEEPENQLYPHLMTVLAEEFRAYSKQGQVFVSTHSPDFLNAIGLDESFYLLKENGYTKIHRANKNKQIVACMNDGDKLGRLWKEGVFDDGDFS
jgi:predicted ATPase